MGFFYVAEFDGADGMNKSMLVSRRTDAEVGIYSTV